MSFPFERECSLLEHRYFPVLASYRYHADSVSSDCLSRDFAVAGPEFLDVAQIKNCSFDVVKMFSIIKSSNRLPLSKLSLPKCILKSIPRYICTIQPTDESERSKSIGRVMSYYLKSIQDKKKVIEDELHEFEIGRYHLARIMGIDIDSMDQKQIDDAIRYLFPSGLYTESARPMMKPPNDIFYKIAEAQFDDSGRPFNSHFYTTKQHLYSALHELGNCLEQADLNLRDCSNNYNTDEMNDFRSQLNQTRCLNKEELMDRFGERISDIEYHKYAATLDRLVNHTNALAFKDVIFKFRIEKALQMSRPEIPPPRMDENGRMYQKATGFRRLSKAEVTVWASGSGKFKIIHPSFVSEDILYFTRIKHR
ncbi:hypothetical protein GJ496_006061 [Pomphorhynchus laevis]|nr:hypothetical protein GJ496_006061 [Pomphorhynchus laevis]